MKDGRILQLAGLDIGARSPAEIGVAIAGELVTWRANLTKKRAARSDDKVEVEDAPANSLAAVASLTEKPS